MSNTVARVSVRILEKEYQVACPADEQPDLQRAASMLNEKMREIRESGKVVGLDRIAVMAALNITNELLQARNAGDRIDEAASARVRSLRQRVEAALGDENVKQLEL